MGSWSLVSTVGCSLRGAAVNQAPRRILDIAEIKSVPLVPMTHPFVERLIATVRRELLDHVPFWHAEDLEHKLHAFQDYFNRARVHHGLGGVPPLIRSDTAVNKPATLAAYRWRDHCRGLYQLPEDA